MAHSFALRRPAGAALAAWLAVSLVCFFWNLGGPFLFDVDEGAFSEATREMLERGDFVTTYLNGQLRFDKPILIYWLQAACVTLFGAHEWSFRLPSALAASAWLFAVLAFVRERFDLRTALVAMTLLGTAGGALVIGRSATADALLNLCLAATLLDVYRYSVDAKRKYVLRAFAWMGVGMLTKGPVALVVPGLVALIYFAVQRRARELWRPLLDPLGWLIFAAIALPWYALELAREGERFVAGFFMKHNVGRFSDTMQGHGGHFFYYVPATLLVLLPHSGLFVRVLAGLRGALRDPLDCFLWIWFGVVFVLFSVSRTQLPHYILYGATPLFILMARHRSLLRSRALAYGPALGLFLLLFFLPDVVEALRSRVTNAYLAETLAAAGGAFGVSYRMATGAAVLLAAYVLWRPPSDVGFGLAALGVAGALVLSTYVVPALSQIQQGPIAAAAHFVAGENATVVASGINAPSFSVYRSAVTPVRTPQPGELALVRVDRLGELPPHDIVFVHAGIRVVRIRGR